MCWTNGTEWCVCACAQERERETYVSRGIIHFFGWGWVNTVATITYSKNTPYLLNFPVFCLYNLNFLSAKKSFLFNIFFLLPFWLCCLGWLHPSPHLNSSELCPWLHSCHSCGFYFYRFSIDLDKSRELEIGIYWRDWRSLCAIKFLRLEEFIDDIRHGMALQLEPQGLLFAEVINHAQYESILCNFVSIYCLFVCVHTS